MNLRHIKLCITANISLTEFSLACPFYTFVLPTQCAIMRQQLANNQAVRLLIENK
jgi:hypothetical protein